MKNLYAIFDKKTEVFSAPTLHQNDNDAIRELDKAVSSQTGLTITMYPDDYTLYRVASYNDCCHQQDAVDKRLIIDYDPPKQVIEISNLPFFVTT